MMFNYVRQCTSKNTSLRHKCRLYKQALADVPSTGAGIKCLDCRCSALMAGCLGGPQSKAPRSPRVSDALRCILSHSWLKKFHLFLVFLSHIYGPSLLMWKCHSSRSLVNQGSSVYYRRFLCGVSTCLECNVKNKLH